MMKTLFKKTTAAKTEYRQANETGMSIFHIKQEEGRPLCGSRKNMENSWVVTVEDVVNSATSQDSRFIWCADCGETFTGKPKAVFNANRFLTSVPC